MSPLALLRTAVRAPGVREGTAVWVLSRALFVLLTYFGVILFNSVLHGPHPSFFHQFLPAWGSRWDAVWYENIAQRGYDWRPPGVQTSPAAFFPLFPLLVHVVGGITGRSYATAGLIISNLCFLGGLIYLWRLADWEFGRQAASRTILYISIFPTALFFFAGYTESLFLLLTVAAFFHLRRGDWLIAGVLAGFASATRVTGILLAVPFIYEYARSVNFSMRRLDARVLSIALVPCGLLAFMAYLQVVVGDALAFTHSQAGWQKAFTVRLWAGTLESLRQVLLVHPHASFFEAHNLIELWIGSLALVLTVYAARRLPAAYTLYSAAFWVATLSNPAIAGGYQVPLISLSRYVLTLFPIFMYLGMLGARREVHDAYLVLSVGLLSLLTVQFINGGWVI